MDRLLWLVAVALAALVGLVAFLAGERRRRRALGAAGPRPAPSIGEALRRSRSRGRVLVVFLDEDEASALTAQALAEDPRVVALLARDGLEHVLVRVIREGREVAAALFEKYAKAELPPGPSALLLDAKGETLGLLRGEGSPLTPRLEGLLGTPPRPGDRPVAEK